METCEKAFKSSYKPSPSGEIRLARQDQLTNNRKPLASPHLCVITCTNCNPFKSIFSTSFKYINFSSKTRHPHVGAFSSFRRMCWKHAQGFTSVDNDTWAHWVMCAKDGKPASKNSSIHAFAKCYLLQQSIFHCLTAIHLFIDISLHVVHFGIVAISVLIVFSWLTSALIESTSHCSRS